MSSFGTLTWSSRPRTWLMITAVFELFLAGIFLVLAFVIPTVRGGFLLTGGILGVVGLGLFAWAAKMGQGLKEAERLRATGLQGQARVVGAATTGTTLNDNPLMDLDLEVTVGARPPYRVHQKTFVPFVMMGTLGMGVSLPVRVDPQDPSKILIEWDQQPTLNIGQQPFGAAAVQGDMGVQATNQPGGGGAAVLGGLGAAALGGLAAAGMAGNPAIAGAAAGTGAAPAMSVNLSQQQALAQHLATSGVSGQATITGVQETGVAVQGQRLYVLDVVVNVPGKQPLATKHAAMVPEAAVGSVVQGATLPARVDTTNPQVFAIDWTAARS